MVFIVCGRLGFIILYIFNYGKRKLEGNWKGGKWEIFFNYNNCEFWKWLINNIVGIYMFLI